MSLGILSGSTLGAQDSAPKFEWLKASTDTMKLIDSTNVELKAAGICPIPRSGFLDGQLCGARVHLTTHSREFFGSDMLFSNPSACDGHENDFVLPIHGCFTPSKLPVAADPADAKHNLILITGSIAALALVYWATKDKRTP